MDRGDGRSLLTVLGLGVLTCNAAVAAYRAWREGDPASVGFVLAAYAALLLLLHFIRRLEQAPAAADRGRLKAAVWALSTMLTVMFASRVAPLMPPAVGVAVWAMAAATAGGGFWAFFFAN
ncbi:unnamed protein product [Urochloa humidicola]